MNVLSISTDTKIFDVNSDAHARQKKYAELLGWVKIIIMCRAGHGYLQAQAVEFRLIPTNSRSRLLYGWDVWQRARVLPKPDVITVQDPFETGLIGLFISWRLGVPLHVQVHTDFTVPGFVQHSVLNRVRRIIAWQVLRYATRIRTVSQHAVEVMHDRGIDAPITVLPIYIDLTKFAAIERVNHSRFKISMLYIGRLEWEKHPCLVVDALHAARKAGHDAGLTIVGEGSARALLEERVRRYGLEGFVDFVGWQSDTTPYLAQADVLLVPSRYEGYGLVIVEALAAGVPVIATDVGVAREAGAIVVAEKDFVEKVVDWVTDGPRTASLPNYPYQDFDAYAQKYVNDIKMCVDPAKKLQ